ncbi:MAG: YgeY family selenium metabolism-linked hydrolase [Thermoanaerobaculales bacterium]|jgi:putative selenium metabolism hydrolase|nr:YgeY family selenium metabolism-linked hydrolase [Thermoanaerobaculales bacterium]
MTTDRGAAALASARQYEDRIVRFLRDMIAIPAESGNEEARCRRVLAEYEALGFDEAFIDGLGTVVARMGSGPVKILMDGHIDCVGVGDRSQWDFDPFEGKHEDGAIWGRGAVDELPAIAAMAYGARILADRGWPEAVTLYLSASVMEEDCDGYCMLHLIEREEITPDYVVLGEPTDLGVYRGQRGRLEATITTRGKSAHGAHAHHGVNALYKMAPIMTDVEELNTRLAHDDFLGTGSIIVSHIACTTPSLNAVPDSATITIDRRLTVGETQEVALHELRSLPHLGDAEVELLHYDRTSWKGARAEQPKYYPTWVLDESHPLVQGVADAAAEVLPQRPPVSRWHFSTNGVATMGTLGIPTVGFAPGLEELAHTTREHVKVEDLVKATAVYSLIPECLPERDQ